MVCHLPSSNSHSSPLLILNFSAFFLVILSLKDRRTAHHTQINIEINCDSIAHLLNELDPSKFHGPDDVLARLLKLLAVEISPCLKLLFSAPLHQGFIPQVWKQAIVTPLFNKCNGSNPSNYRPISLTCICCKILEYIIHTNIMSHFSSCNILCRHSIWILKNYSAELQLIKVSHDLAYSLNNKGQTDVVLLDFSNTFGKVSHHLLQNYNTMEFRTGFLIFYYYALNVLYVEAPLPNRLT